MRAFTILVAALVATGVLAGCIGNAAEKDPETENIDPATIGTDLTSETPGSGLAPVKVLAPLASSLKLGSAAWVAPGTSVPVTAAAPANAKGDVTYTWATGALPGTTEVKSLSLDTKVIEPTASKVLTFTTAGVFRMHCHPHPAMKHNVTVVDGLAPSDVTVDIVDGATMDKYRFVPENIVVGVGSKVTYVNKGKLAHTATAEAQEPPLKKVALDKASGDIKLEGNGWQRIVVLMRDSEGRFGIAEKAIYTTATLPAFTKQEIPVDFAAAGPAPLAGTPAESAMPAPQAVPVTLEQAGLVSINGTYTDAVGGSPVGAAAGQNLAQVELHFTKDGETQDALTGEAAATHTLSGKAPAGQYTLRIVPIQGAQITGTIVIEVVYELVPPAPTAPAAAEEGHGGHAH